MTLALDASAGLLLRDFHALRARGRPCVLATVIDTAGSTYRKPGARMLLTREGETFGLLSGGCLEQDLAQRAHDVLDSGRATVVSYDMRGADDLIFGFGAGCEGAMQVLLQRVGLEENWQPLRWLADCVERRIPDALATIVDSAVDALPPGSAFWTGGGTTATAEPAALAVARTTAISDGHCSLLALDAPRLTAFVAPVILPPALLLLGAGPDAVPLARLATGIGFGVTVIDHRPAYAQALRFPGCQVLCGDADRLAETVDLGAFAAAVIMSHYLPADAAYLRALAGAGPDYVGLLGPAARRERLLAETGAAAAGLAGRLRGPVGLDIGAQTPEAIALAVVAEIHAVLAGRSAEPFSSTATPPATAGILPPS